MGGFRRLKPTIIYPGDRTGWSCATLGCPDRAVVSVPLNATVKNTFDQIRRDEGNHPTEPFTLYGHELELRLCRRCIRTFASALMPGERLPGARLRYPELDPDVWPEGRAPEEIPNTPEYDAAVQRASAPIARKPRKP